MENSSTHSVTSPLCSTGLVNCPTSKIFVIFHWGSALIVHNSLPRYQRNIVQQCASTGLDKKLKSLRIPWQREAIWESYFTFQGRLSRTSPQSRNTTTRLVQLLRIDWHEYVSQAYQDIYYVAESFDDVKTKLRWSLSGTNLDWRATTPGFGRRPAYRDRSRCATSRSVRPSRFWTPTVPPATSSRWIRIHFLILRIQKNQQIFGSTNPNNHVSGVEDPGEPTIGCFSTDFRKLNILIEERAY